MSPRTSSVERKNVVVLAAVLFVAAVCVQASEKRRAAPVGSGVAYYRINIDGIVALAPDDNSSVWFLPDFLDSPFVGHLASDGSISRLPLSNTPLFLALDPGGALWVATTGGFVKIVEASTKASVSYSGSISGIALDGTGTLWFTDRAHNLVCFVGSDNEVVQYPLPDALNQPSYIALGPDAKMWVVAQSGNIGSLGSDGSISQHPIAEASGRPITAVVSTPNALWIAVGCRPCNHASCPHPEDHGLLLRVASDYSVSTIADIGHNNFLALAPGPNETMYAVEAKLSSPDGQSYAGPLLIVRAAAVEELATGVFPPLAIAGASLAVTSDGTVWGVYWGGAISPVVFRFPPWRLR